MQLKTCDLKEEEERTNVSEWIRQHPDVVCHPLRRDTSWILAATSDNPTGTAKEIKLLIHTNMRELHLDLPKSETGQKQFEGDVLPQIILQIGNFKQDTMSQ